MLRSTHPGYPSSLWSLPLTYGRNIDFQHGSSTIFYLAVCHWWRFELWSSSIHNKKTRSALLELSSPEAGVGGCCTPVGSYSMALGCWDLYSWSRNPLPLHKQRIRDSRATGEVSQVWAHHRAVCTGAQIHFCTAGCFTLQPQQTQLFRAYKINGLFFFFLFPLPQPGPAALSAEKEREKKKKRLPKVNVKNTLLVSTIRLYGNVKCLLRSSEKRKRRRADTWQCVKVYNLAVKGEKTVKIEERSQAQRQGWLSKCLKLISIWKGRQEFWGGKKREKAKPMWPRKGDKYSGGKNPQAAELGVREQVLIAIFLTLSPAGLPAF